MAAATEQKRSPLVTYVEGDATTPKGEGLKIIAHCCNNANLWGAGFVLAISRKWERPAVEYHAWLSRSQHKDLLGAVQLVPVENDIRVANIIGQHGVGRAPDGTPPIRYKALGQGFEHIARFALNNPDRNVSVHLPRIGCGLAGASWAKVEPLLDQHFVAHAIPVTVYTFPGGRFNS